MPRRDGKPSGSRSPEAKQAAFLAAYVQCGANVTMAAALAGISRRSHSNWMAEVDYRERFEDAHAEALDAVEAEIHRRAVIGIDKPIVYQGKITYEGKGKNCKPVTVKEYSDTLLIFRAKKLIPEYRDRMDVSHSGQVATLIVVEDENWYSNDAHSRLAESAPAPTASALIASAVQGGSVRSTVGQDGAGVIGDSARARPA